MSLVILERKYLAAPEFSNRKYVISGNTVEEYLYEKPQSYHLLFDQTKSKGRGVKRRITPEQEVEIERLSAKRAKQNLRRLVDANHLQWKNAEGKQERHKFLTLTFAENEQDLDKANHLFTDFIKRFNYAIFHENKNYLKYIAVHEVQARGAIHYHIIFFNLPYMRNDAIQKIWGHGFTKPKQISSIKNVGAYMAKYLTKQGGTARKKHQKRYFASKGLLLPRKVRNQKRADKIAFLLREEKSTFSFKSDNAYAPYEYNVYDLSKRSALRESVVQCAQEPV